MNHQDDVVSQVIDYIEFNIFEELSLSRLSAFSGYSKWHLQRLFKRYVGIQIGRYIGLRRLSKSAILLKQSKNKILDISLASGFGSQQCYSRAFKTKFNKTPNEFRSCLEWDFSNQTPPFNANRKTPCDYITIQSNLDLIELNYMYACNSDDKYMTVKGELPCDKEWVISGWGGGYILCKFESNYNKLVQKDFLIHVRDFNFVSGRFAMFSFNGTFEDYIVFFNRIYDEFLPSLNAKVRKECVIELHKNNSFSFDEINVKVLIPIFDVK